MHKPITIMYLKVCHLNTYFRSPCSYLEYFDLPVQVVCLDSSVSYASKRVKNLNSEVLKQRVSYELHISLVQYCVFLIARVYGFVGYSPNFLCTSL